jgi:D-serine dehydratase
MNLDEINATILDGRTKGVPGSTEPFALRDIAKKAWNVLREDLPLPLMVLKRSALDHNAAAFAEYLVANGLSLAPHGKTTMAPQIFAEQLKDGAWGITAATVNQVRVMRAYGVDRIILGNQLVGRPHVQWIAAELNANPKFDFYCFIDSVANLRTIDHHLEGIALSHPIKLLLDFGAVGGRTGVRTLEEAKVLVDAIHGADRTKFRLTGVAGHEGALAGLDKSSQPVRNFADFAVEITKNLPVEQLRGLDEFILSAGGSSYYDIIAEHFKTVKLDVPIRVLLRSGCYVTHDSGAYDAAHDEAEADPHRHGAQPELVPALEVWAYVQSLPEPGLGFLTMGKRDIPFDAGLPKPVKLYRPGVGFLDVGEAKVSHTNDQHAYVRLGQGTDWQVGDLVASGISHPCTAFDKWRFIPVVDDDYTVIDGVLTFF